MQTDENVSSFLFSTDPQLLEVVESLIDTISKQSVLTDLARELQGSAEVTATVSAVLNSIAEDACAYVSRISYT